MTVKSIQLNTFIKFKEVNENTYEIRNNRDIQLANANEDYHIYMREVVFHKDGTFEGIYLGKNPQSILDEHCREAEFDKDKGWMLPDGVYLKTARMVAVENKSGVLVVIQDR